MIVDLDLKRENSILHLSETIQNSMFDPRSRDISETVRVKGKTVLVRCRGCIVLLCPERGRIARVVINNVTAPGPASEPEFESARTDTATQAGTASVI